MSSTALVPVASGLRPSVGLVTRRILGATACLAAMVVVTLLARVPESHAVVAYLTRYSPIGLAHGDVVSLPASVLLLARPRMFGPTTFFMVAVFLPYVLVRGLGRAVGFGLVGHCISTLAVAAVALPGAALGWGAAVWLAHAGDYGASAALAAIAGALGVWLARRWPLLGVAGFVALAYFYANDMVVHAQLATRIADVEHVVAIAVGALLEWTFPGPIDLRRMWRGLPTTTVPALPGLGTPRSGASASTEWRATPAPSSSRPSRGFAWLARPAVLGVVVSSVGLLGVVSAFTPALPRRVELLGDLLDPGWSRVAAGTTALIGVVLVVLGRGLARRRRSAYVAALALLAVSVVGHVAKGLDVEEAAIATAVIVLLVRSRAEFTVLAPPGRRARVARVAALLVLGDIAVGLVGLALGAPRFRLPVKPGLALLAVVRMLGGASPGTVHFHGAGHFVPLGLVLLGITTAGVLLVVAFAPAPAPAAEPAPRDQVRELIERADGDTLDPFALREDKHYVFSTDGTAAIAYRVVSGVALASGDPVGEPAAFADALDTFVALCDERGWRPAIMGVRDDRLDLYTKAGLRAQYLGDEAVVSVPTFSLEGRAMRAVRQAVSRTHNFGITTEVTREGDLDPELRRTLVRIARRARRGAPERGFSMALDALLSGRDPDSVVVVARDEEGHPFAFQRYIPCRAGRALSLDAMRRDRGGPNGVNERLIVDTIAWAREQGIEEVSLNFAFCRTLVRVEEPAALGAAARAQAWLVRRLNPHFQIESLLHFNEKFKPRWIPRSLVYRSIGDLAMVATAAASAEGFLPFDRASARRGGAA